MVDSRSLTPEMVELFEIVDFEGCRMDGWSLSKKEKQVSRFKFEEARRELFEAVFKRYPDLNKDMTIEITKKYGNKLLIIIWNYSSISKEETMKKTAT